MILQHVDTEQFLHSHAMTFKHPIPGQQEVTCFPHKNENTKWVTAVKINPVPLQNSYSPFVVEHRRVSISHQGKRRTSERLKRTDWKCLRKRLTRMTMNPPWTWIRREWTILCSRAIVLLVLRTWITERAIYHDTFYYYKLSWERLRLCISFHYPLLGSVWLHLGRQGGLDRGG